ncbi:MAG: protein BatD, partial [Muribaculaceae bacterium]|nr:protein BatD [Muribaculaceae bacterium]
VVYRRQIRLDADVAGRKLAKAGRVASKRLRTARSHMNTGNSDAFYQSLAQALWGYISDKLNIAPSQLTRGNVEGKLHQYGLTPEATSNVLDVLDRCEMARFTPEHSKEEVEQLYEKANAAIRSIEDVKKR